MAKMNTYNQSFWYFKPDAALPFGMHKGKKLIDVVRSDYKYLSYCLAKLDHFMLSRPVFRYLQKTDGLVLSSEAIEILGQKADKADAFLLKGVYSGYKNKSKTGSVFKNIHAKGTHDLLNYQDFFKFVEFSDFSKITDTNYAWFSKFFGKVIGEDKDELNGVKCSIFFINHRFKNVWFKWLAENWFGGSNGDDLYSFSINIFEPDIDVAIIVVVNTKKSSYSKHITRVATSHRGGKSEIVTIPARNEYMLPSLDFWRHLLTHDENKQTNWIIDSLRAKALKNYGQEISIDGKSISSKILAYKSYLHFYLKDEGFSSLVENYYTKIKPSDFLEKRNKFREEADCEELLDPASHDDVNHDEDAWDALTDGQYGDYDDRFN